MGDNYIFDNQKEETKLYNHINKVLILSKKNLQELILLTSFFSVSGFNLISDSIKECLKENRNFKIKLLMSGVLNKKDSLILKEGLIRYNYKKRYGTPMTIEELLDHFKYEKNIPSNKYKEEAQFIINLIQEGILEIKIPNKFFEDHTSNLLRNFQNITN